ncbi:MAG: four helix bundle protein [Nitrospirae bacterium]|nr:four helix bundle protein [Nitrospirota bacterium]
MITSYKDLIVWQRAMELVTAIYKLTENFPKSEIYGLTSQMRRAAVSIPSNIAEGKMRGTRKDYRHFLLNAYGSGAELETQIEIAKQLCFGRNIDFNEPSELLEEVMKMLNALIKNLKPIT